jgi:hypothetical protein
MRPCYRCHEAKPASEFNKGSNKDGLHSYCKTCCRVYFKQRNHELQQVHYGRLLAVLEPLRVAILESNQSLSEIARGSGVAIPIISRFVSGVRPTIRVFTASKIANYLGCNLRHSEHKGKETQHGSTTLPLVWTIDSSMF